MKKYYKDAKDNAAFDRCIDVMTRMILKYGPKVLELQEKETENVKDDGSEEETAA